MARRIAYVGLSSTIPFAPGFDKRPDECWQRLATDRTFVCRRIALMGYLLESFDECTILPEINSSPVLNNNAHYLEHGNLYLSTHRLQSG